MILTGESFGVFSFSKTYAMTGYRVGYAIADESITTQMAKLQEATVSCACGMAQKAAEAALLESQNCVSEMVKVYRKNRDVAVDLLDQYGIPYQQPEGAFYIWIYVGCKDSTDFAKQFLLEYKVSLAPGSTFGPIGNPYVRISLAANQASIEEGIHRLARMMKKI